MEDDHQILEGVNVLERNVEEQNFEPQAGTGRITSSSTIVQGHFTKFMDELKPGDASMSLHFIFSLHFHFISLFVVIVTHPTSLMDEMKVVRIVVSNISMSLSSPFSTDLISTTPFRLIFSLFSL